jgi:SAF domain-containing protein
VAATATGTPPHVERARANALGWGDGQGPRPRRRRGRIAAGVTLVIVSGWLAAVIFLSVGSRREVLAVADSVDQFDELAESDFRVVRVAADTDVDLVPADRLDELVGSVAATDLGEGSLLTEGQLLDPEEALVGANEATVGTVLAPAAAPANLASGAQVEIVIRPGAGSEGAAQTLRGWVLEVGDSEETQTGGRRVTLVVSADAAAVVSAAAAEERVSVVVLGDG